MMLMRNKLIGLAVLATSLGALAQKADEHKDHHPAGGNAAAAPAAPASAPGMAVMDQHMKAMQAMHDKMMAAKTPEARQALMAEHMKLMQEGMAMMKGMGGKGMGGKGMGGMGMAGGHGAGMAEHHQMMEKRMEMMASMMQMMMDRMPAATGK